MRAATGSVPPGSAPRRRNGRQQACEPCRLRKVSCDHRLPICSRCRRGRISCVYTTQKPANPTPSTTSLDSDAQHEQPSPSASPVEWTQLRPESNIGYLGPTSFSAVFQDTRSTLQTIQAPMLVFEDENNRYTDTCKAVDRATLDLAISVLRSVPRKQAAINLFAGRTNVCDSWYSLAGWRLMESVWASFGPYLEGKRDAESLGCMGRRLCHNGTIPFDEEHKDAEEWLACFSGPNLRWEALGLLFTYWAYGSLTVPEFDGEDRNVPRRNVMMKYKYSASRCAQLCQNDSHGNTLLLQLLFKNSLLESIDSGDASKATWKLHSEVVALATFMGIHAATDKPEDDWCASVQIKRRAFAAVFNIDKAIASIAGRPPMISRRFSSTPLPFDISDEYFFSTNSPGPDIQQQIDKNGWRTDGTISAITILRARAMMSYKRDAILEIALKEPDSTSTDILFDLKEQVSEIASQFPSAIIYRDNDIDDPAIHARVLFMKLLVRLEYLQNLFFIERLLNMAGAKSIEELLEVSMEMVKLTLLFWTHQKRLSEVQCNCECMIIAYAAPAGGVLCMELLRSNRQGGGSSTTRSSIVQQLSLLVGFLDWVAPTAPNGGLCTSVKNVIQHVLDEALNTSALGIADGIADWGAGLSVELNEFFNFDLMDTFDWLRPESQLQ